MATVAHWTALADDSLPQFRFLAPDQDQASAGPERRLTITAAPLYNATDMTNDDSDTSVNVDLAGVVGTLGYSFNRDNRLALHAGYGFTDIDYTERYQELREQSYSFGLNYETALQAVHFDFGGSFARDFFRSKLSDGDDAWSGWEKEAHLSINVPFEAAPEFWITPLLGTRFLDLAQAKHDLGAVELPKEYRWSRLFYGGVSFEWFDDAASPGHVFKPWAFAGFTYETAGHSPQGPSVFVGNQMAGNNFSVYTKYNDVPRGFAGGITGVFSVGLSAEVTDGMFVDAFYYRSMNKDYTQDALSLGMRLTF